jgi:hypothetical protein
MPAKYFGAYSFTIALLNMKPPVDKHTPFLALYVLDLPVIPFYFMSSFDEQASKKL